MAVKSRSQNTPPPLPPKQVTTRKRWDKMGLKDDRRKEKQEKNVQDDSGSKASHLGPCHKVRHPEFQQVLLFFNTEMYRI